MKSLESLALSRNLIKNIALGSFQSLEHLKRLDLERNKLGNITTGMFGGLKCLEWLNLKNNTIEFLEMGSLDVLSGKPCGYLFKSIDLSYNFLSSIPVGIFNGLPLGGKCIIIDSKQYMLYIQGVSKVPGR